MWSHLSFVYNLLVTDLSVQIYTTYRHFLKIQKQQDALPLVLKSPADLCRFSHCIYCSMLLDITSSDADCTPSHDVEQ